MPLREEPAPSPQLDDYRGLRQAAKRSEATRRRSRRVAGVLANAFLGLAFLVFAAGLTVIAAAFGPRLGLDLPLDEMGLLGEIAASIDASTATTGGTNAEASQPRATIALPSPNPTATPSRTPTASLTNTATPTPLPSNTPTPSRTPTKTLTPSRTPRPSNTPSGTQPTATFTASPAPTEIGFPGCDPSGNSAFETTLFGLINDERKAAGLPAYVQDSQLRAAARIHSTDMACNGFFSHTGSDGSDVGERVAKQGYEGTQVAENLFGTGDTSSNAPQQALDWWLASAAHRANLLSAEFSEIGIGYIYEASSPFGGYFTAVFARP